MTDFHEEHQRMVAAIEAVEKTTERSVTSTVECKMLRDEAEKLQMRMRSAGLLQTADVMDEVIIVLDSELKNPV